RRGWDKTISASKTERVNSRFGNILRFPLQSISATSVQGVLEQCLLYDGSIKSPQDSPCGILIRLFLRRPGRSNVGVGHKALRWDEHLAQSQDVTGFS